MKKKSRNIQMKYRNIHTGREITEIHARWLASVVGMTLHDYCESRGYVLID